MTTPLIEAIARAIEPDWFGEVDGKHPLDNYPLQHEAYQTRARAYAQAALTAITEAGYAVVPVEPDDAMICAGIIERQDQATPEAWSLATANIYRAMINAVTHCNHTNNGKAE